MNLINDFQRYYLLFLLLILLQRVFEIFLSKRNEKKLFARSDKNQFKEYASEKILPMKIFHALWFVSLIIELLLQKSNTVMLGSSLEVAVFVFLGTILVVLSQVLRLLSVLALGERWTIKVIGPVKINEAIMQRETVKKGIYKFLRHPNYIAVIVEFIAIPIIAKLYVTLIIFSIINLFIIRDRVKLENRINYTSQK